MCGEHFLYDRFAMKLPGSSPHVRGALALISLTDSGSRDHPRMCGEHHGSRAGSSLVLGSSPHVRGARRRWGRFRCPRGIIPACAGSTRAKRTGTPYRRDHPRMCGEHILRGLQFRGLQGSSPHVRGAPQDDLTTSIMTGIIPACAGSTCATPQTYNRQRDHPRMCGEHPLWLLEHDLNVGSSPHVRGALAQGPVVGVHRGIIPACAGST